MSDDELPSDNEVFSVLSSLDEEGEDELSHDNEIAHDNFYELVLEHRRRQEEEYREQLREEYLRDEEDEEYLREEYLREEYRRQQEEEYHEYIPHQEEENDGVPF